jgi:uncharacterized phage protein (TIGR02218 family)
MELRSRSQALQQTIGEVYTPYCRADLGDNCCGIELDDSAGTYVHNGTVMTVTEARVKFTDDTIDSSITTDVFRFGLLTWLEPSSGDSYNGANARLQMEIKSFNATTGEFELFEKMPYDIETGDEFEVTWGCDKSATTCKDTFDNLVNFRGEPFVPSKDNIAKIGVW